MKKKWYRKKGIKIFWIVLMHCMAVLVVCCAAAAALLMDAGINLQDWKKPYIMSEIYADSVFNACMDIMGGINYEEYKRNSSENKEENISTPYVYSDGYAFQRFGEGRTNITYLYADNDTKKVYTNKNEYNDYDRYEEFVQEISDKDSSYVVVYFSAKENTAGMDAGQIQIKDWNVWEHTMDEIAPSDDYVFAAQIDKNFPVMDMLADNKETYDKYASWLLPAIVSCVGATLLLLTGLVWLTLTAGRRTEDEEIHLCAFDRWFTEAAAVCIGWIWIFGVLFGYHFMPNGNDFVDIAAAAAISFFTMALFLTGYLSLVRRIKAKTLWKNSLLRWFLTKCKAFWGKSKTALAKDKTAQEKSSDLLGKGSVLWEKTKALCKKGKALCKKIWKKLCSLSEFYSRNTGSRVKVTLLSGSFMAAHIIVIFLAADYWYWMPEVPMIILGIFDGGVLVYLIKKAAGREKIMEGLKRISDGELQYKIPLEKLSGELKIMAEYINNIGAGLDAAVEKSVKDERMKTELITNVSHDIKTPLTSIINYVDLLKRENFTDEKICGYLDILEEKSQRLKILTEDVVEASKASTGNITFEKTNLNFVEMVNQVIGEFREKLEEKHLTVMVHLTDEPTVIYADGRRMWRVLENIFNNVVKYAMEGTRVYIQVEKEEKTAVFSLKNISAQSLNISADELTERFIRGDISRNTEGSGLGLSIAKSLTELQGGEFRLYLDGDLFKVTIAFPEV